MVLTGPNPSHCLAEMHYIHLRMPFSVDFFSRTSDVGQNEETIINVSVLFKGHDTTSSAIMWVLNSLAKYPDMQRRVREDVLEVLQGRERLQM